MSKIDKVILDNGLTIYFYIDKKRHSTFFQHITKFGGATKDFICDGVEYHVQDGIAHILEHYIVEENIYGNFLKLLGEKQMTTNASTHFDMTRFYFNAVENVEYGIRTLLNCIYSPKFDEERLEKIKGPIYQEIRGKSDNKFFHLNRKCFENMFHNYSFRNVGGTLEEVENTTLDDLKLCYRVFYQPSNQIIVVGGNFDKDKILQIIKDVYNNLNIEKHQLELINISEQENVKKEYDEILFPTGQNYIDISYKINLDKYSIKDKLKLDFYFNYFCKMYFGLTSPLYNNLVKESLITGGIGYSLTKFNNYFVVSVGCHCDDVELVERKIKDTIIKLNCFNETMFELDKKETILDLILRQENIANMIMPFVANIISYNYPYPDSKEQVMEYTYEDFVKTMKEIDFSNCCVTVIKNKE